MYSSSYKSFDLNGEWSPENYDDYYKYFTHPDIKHRKYSILIFLAALAHWFTGSVVVFMPIKVREKSKYYDPERAYVFEDYVISFLASREAIKEEFPIYYEIIISYLFQHDKNKRFEYLFREVDKQIFVDLREVLNENPALHEKMFIYTTNDILNVLQKEEEKK